MKVKVSSLGQRMFSSTPHVVRTSYGPGEQPSSGYAASAATEWPGISISGTIVMWRSFAYAMTSRIWSCV